MVEKVTSLLSSIFFVPLSLSSYTLLFSFNPLLTSYHRHYFSPLSLILFSSLSLSLSLVLWYQRARPISLSLDAHSVWNFVKRLSQSLINSIVELSKRFYARLQMITFRSCEESHTHRGEALLYSCMCVCVCFVKKGVAFSKSIDHIFFSITPRENDNFFPHELTLLQNYNLNISLF